MATRRIRGASAGAVLMVFAASADAQDQQRESTARNDIVGEVVVTGLRYSVESAQAIKQNAEQIVDSVTAQDIGALPDRSVSEALQRIPGITLQRTSANRDPARLAAEGGGVFIRGLSWVRSELNGRDVFSANNGRDLSFEDVSSDLLAGVDVYKNPSAELVEGGIGGIVNLRTRRPFDSDKRLFAVSGDYNYADLYEKGFVSGNLLYSDQWAVGGGRVGALLSASVSEIGNRTDSVQSGRYEARTLSPGDAATLGMTAGDTVFMPNAIGARSIEWEQERNAFAAAFQWEPSEALLFTLQGLYSEANPHDLERLLGDDWGFPTAAPDYLFDDRGVLVAGTIPEAHLTADTRFGEQEKNTADYSLGFKYLPGERWAVSGDVQYVRSNSVVTSLTAFTQVSPPLSSIDFDLRGETPFLNFNNDRLADPSAYWWAAAMDHLEDNDANSWAQRLDAEYSFDDTGGFLRSLRLGVRATDRDAVTRQSGWNWGYLSQQFWCIGCGAPAFLSDSPANSAEFFPFENFFRGDVNHPGVAWLPTGALLRGGPRNAYDSVLGQVQGVDWGWRPFNGDFANQSMHADNGNRGINDQSEETRAAYGMLRFGHDTPIGPLDGNIGVRVVRTENSTVATPGVQARVGDSENTADPNGTCDSNTQDCSWWNTAQGFVLGFTPVGAFTVDNSYTDVLPSLNLRFLLRPELQLRFAAGKAIVRPTFAQMQGSTLLTFDNTGTQPKLGVANSGIVGYGGNPSLKPIRATQFDTSLEWYFDSTGSLTFAAFYKDIKDYIFAGQQLETFTSGGETVDFLVTRNLNGEKGKIQGFELAYQQFYDELPGILSGLGFQANFTYVDSSGGKNGAINALDRDQTNGANNQELPLEGLSKTSYNVAVLYEKHGLSARLAYNWRERYLLTTSAANIDRPVWFDDYGQLDGSVFYSVTDSIKVGVQATNLTNTRTLLEVGGATLSPRYSWTDTDRRVALAVRMSF
jgi:TonB-dependent receptor